MADQATPAPASASPAADPDTAEFWLAKKLHLPRDTGDQRRQIVLDDYYLSVVPESVEHQSGLWTNSRGSKLFWQTYAPKGHAPKAVVCRCLGYVDQSSMWVQDEAFRFVERGLALIVIEYEGHGRSDGLHGYIPDFAALCQDASDWFSSKRADFPSIPFFLFGLSMGGAVAIHVNFIENAKPEGERQPYKGTVLVCPMVKISDEMKPHWLATKLLTQVARVMPTLPIVPSRDVLDWISRDKAKNAMIASHPLRYDKKPRLKTGVELLQASLTLEQELERVDFPFLVLHGKADVVTDPQLSEELHKRAASKDKTILLYDDAWHGLSLEHVADQYWADLLGWIEAHVGTE